MGLCGRALTSVEIRASPDRAGTRRRCGSTTGSTDFGGRFSPPNDRHPASPASRRRWLDSSPSGPPCTLHPYPARTSAVYLLTLERQRQCGVISGLNLPVTITSHDDELLLRRATAADLHSIVRLLSDDPISAGRGDVASTADEVAYAEALQRIIDDPSNDVLVVEDDHTAVIGTLQLTTIPGMARRGSARLLVEAVRVASAERSSGVGTALMRWIVEQAAVELRTPLVQLTSDAARTDAHRFYRRLGFIDSHVGFKFAVTLPDALAR